MSIPDIVVAHGIIKGDAHFLSSQFDIVDNYNR